MTINYEALVGHLFVVGGRSINSPPPGAQLQPAPKRAHRSREQDTLFVLITPAGQMTAKAEFFEKLAQLAADSYFKSRLGVTGALRETATLLNQRIQQINQQHAADYRAGMLLMVKRGDDVYLARSGTTLCIARLKGNYTTFPTDPDLLNILPLGSRPEPVLEFTHFGLAPNDLFILGDAGVAALSDDLLKGAAATGDIERVFDRLERAVGRQALATIIQFVNADAAPPIEPEPEPPAKPSPVSAPSSEPEETPATSTPAPAAASLQVEDDEPEVEDALPIPPPPSPARSAESSQPTRKGAMAAVLAGLMLLLSNILRSFANALDAILDRLLPQPEQGDRNQPLIPMNVVALVAVIIPAIIGVIVVGLAISNRGTTEFEELRSTALIALDEAQTLEDDSNAAPKDKRNAWLEVRNWAERARRENPNSSEMRDLILDAQNFIDYYDRITRVEVETLREYGENADLRGPILAPNSQDVYVLDRNRSQVFRDMLDGTGQRLIEETETPILERARPVNEYLVSNLIDIEWLEQGGVGQTKVLVALDDNGLLVSYHGTFGLSALQLELPPDWNRPEAIATWDVNLYVLDAGANQIWRFRPESGFYQNPPEEYFSGNNRPELGAAVDMGIDDQGYIYILFDDGTVSKYFGSEPANFELYEQTAPVDGISNGYAIYLSADPQDYALYLADRDNAALYQISLGGRVNGGYRPADILSDAFDRISGAFVDPARGNIYIVSGNALYLIPKIL